MPLQNIGQTHRSYPYDDMNIKFLIAIFLLTAAVPFSAHAAQKGVTCKSMIFSDSTKVKRLYGKNVNTKILPASTTKVMTVLLAMEKLPLERYVTVSARAQHVQPSKLNLKPGERYKVGDLILAALLNSANDATVVLAEAVAGSEGKFAQMMNQHARALGAKNTRFANSNGLPTKKGTQYSTAYDMYLIFRKAMQYPFFREAIKMKYAAITSSGGRNISLKSHNKMLFMGWKQNIYGKTGWTRRAKACFIGTLQKGESTLIIGAFGCSDRWSDIKRVVTTYGGVAL